MGLSRERSKAAPLEIWLRLLDVERGPWFQDLLAPYIQKTEVQKVVFIPSAKEQVFPGFPQSMSNLRSLTFFGEDFPYRVGPVDPFGSFTPTLESLSLSRIPFHPALLRLKSLTEFVCENQYDLHLDILLDFLEENRSLKRGDLDITFTEQSIQNLRPRAAISTQL